MTVDLPAAQVKITTESSLPRPPLPTGTPRWVWMLLILLTAVIVSGAAGLLSYAGGASIPNAILTGGGSFAGAVALLLRLAHFLGGGRPPA